MAFFLTLEPATQTGVTVGANTAQGGASPIRLSSWLPRCPGAVRHPFQPSPSLVRVWRLFGTFFLAPQPRDPNGGHSGVRCGTREGITNTAQPMAAAVARGRPASPPAISVARTDFGTFFRAGAGPPWWCMHTGPRTVGFHTRGGSGGEWGWKSSVQGPPCGLFRWPHRRCGQAGHLPPAPHTRFWGDAPRAALCAG